MSMDGERYTLVRRTWLTKIFVGGDVLAFLIQSTGASMMTSGDKNKTKTGSLIIVGSLFLQIAFFGFFILVAVLFQRRGREHRARIGAKVPWKRQLYTLYATSLFILIRSIFRVIEYIEGDNGYMLRHEVFLYVFDANLMFVVMVVMNVVHPGDIALLLKEKSASANRAELEPFRGQTVV